MHAVHDRIGFELPEISDSVLHMCIANQTSVVIMALSYYPPVGCSLLSTVLAFVLNEVIVGTFGSTIAIVFMHVYCIGYVLDEHGR